MTIPEILDELELINSGEDPKAMRQALDDLIMRITGDEVAQRMPDIDELH